MQKEMLVESRSYDQFMRGSWRAYRIIDEAKRIGDEQIVEQGTMPLRLWLPASTSMNWATGTRPLRYNCLQLFWPERWYMLSAFYNGRLLMHTYANIIHPPLIQLDRVSYVDLDLSILVEPDLSYEVLTQVEFDQAAEQLNYDEQTRISALMAQRSLTSSIQRSVGVFTYVPHTLSQTDFHLAQCS